MKCSLLTLSTFIDGELAPQRRSEVDAHLVGCTRCSAGAATLREEKSRVGQLARVRVDPASAQLMLEQVGITLDSVVDRSPVMPPPPPALPDTQRPWQGGGSSPALPWTPRRPEPVPPAIEEMTVATVSPDVQPDLPLDAMRSAPASWEKVAEDDPEASPEVEATAAHPSLPAPPDTGWADADDDWLDAAAPPESWEADLPPPVDPTRDPDDSWSAPPAPVAPFEPPVPAPVPAPPLHAPPPTRLAAASGPTALWTRVRDAVTVRLALARGGDALEDSLQIVSGAPSRRGAQLPPPVAPSIPDIVAAAPAPQAQAHTESPAEQAVELNGFAGHTRPSPATIDAREATTDVPERVADPRPSRPADVIDDRDHADAVEPAGWNAFAASSYPGGDDTIDQPPAVAPRPLGRHSRAVAREQIPLFTRITRGLASMAAAIRVGTITAAVRVRQTVGGISSAGPDNRMLAGIAGIGLIFVIALLIGHTSSHPVSPTATRPATSSAATQPHPSAPAQSGAAASTTGAPAPAHVQTFGAGDTGFQVTRLFYGAHPGYLRVVFGLGAVSGNAGGTPKVTVSFSSPTSMLVTFNGTVPAGSTGTPTPGKVISSVTLVSSSGNKTVYRFGLTRAATVTAFYLASPTRFVLDVH